MPRTRWIVIGGVLAISLIGGAINARGPFAAHPPLAYPQFLADFQAGRVDQMAQWRDQLEVTKGSQLLSVVVPAGTDLAADVGQARVAGGVGISWATIPDAWLGQYTPWVPALILLAGAFIWTGALVRNRRANRTNYFAPSEP